MVVKAPLDDIDRVMADIYSDPLPAEVLCFLYSRAAPAKGITNQFPRIA
jgi:hypothetical protein